MRTHHRRWHILSLVTLLCLGFLGLSVAAAAPETAPRLDEACQELLQDGGFESSSGWTLNPSAYPAGYVPQPTHSGQQAMRLGIVESFNRWAYSSIQQKVTLPATAQRITLRFYVYPLSEAPAGDDEQLMALLNPSSLATIAVPWRALSNGQAWSEQVVDLSTYRGQTLLVYFNVYNDGSGGRTALYLDDVSLQACPAATATPTPKPTEPPTSTPQPSATGSPIPWPTPTPPPGPCRPQCLPNGDFESYGYWTLGKTPLYPAYVSGKGVGGSRAMQLGNVGQSNVLSYSSVRQDVYIPTEASSVGLRFWYWPLSEGPDSNDHQELLLLQPQSQQVIAILWRDTRDDRQWRQGWADLTPHRGQVVSVYFNVYNDGAGGRTAMYLDDVCLELCGAISPTCLPKTPTPCCPTPTPTSCGPQPCPTCCYPPCDQPWCTRTATPTPTPEITPTATPTLPCGSVPPVTPPHRWWPWPVRPPLGWWGHPLFWLILATVLALLLLLLAVLLLNRIRRLLQKRERETPWPPPEPEPVPIRPQPREDEEREVAADIESHRKKAEAAEEAIISAMANIEELREGAREAARALSSVVAAAQRHLDGITAAAAATTAAAAVMEGLVTGEPTAPPVAAVGPSPPGGERPAEAAPPAEKAAAPPEAAPTPPVGIIAGAPEAEAERLPEAAPPPEAAPAAEVVVIETPLPEAERPPEATPPPEEVPVASSEAERLPEAAPPPEEVPVAPPEAERPPETAPPPEAAPVAEVVVIEMPPSEAERPPEAPPPAEEAAPPTEAAPASPVAIIAGAPEAEAERPLEAAPPEAAPVAEVVVIETPPSEAAPPPEEVPGAPPEAERPPETAPPAEEAIAPPEAASAPPPEAESPSSAALLLQGTEYEGLELTAGTLDLLERLTVLRPSPQTSEMRDGILQQLKEAQEFREESLLSSLAVAGAALEDDDTAFVGKTYVLQTGVAWQDVKGLAGEPFDLPFQNAFDPVVFDILVHGGAHIELLEWQKRLRYEPLNPKPQFVEFAFLPTAAGRCSLGVDFYHEQRWLRTMRLEFDAVEAPSSEPSV